MELKKSKTQALLEKGKILEAWPFKDGEMALSVVPAVEIDRVKFSFFPKGKSGKGGFDIYVDGIIFYQLIQDLRAYRGQIPEKWEYRTGNNGCKILSLEKGQKAFVVFKGSDTNKKLHATRGLTKDQLIGMVNLYDMFYKDLFKKLWEQSFDLGRKNSYNYENELSADDEETAPAPVEETEENNSPPEPQPETEYCLTSASQFEEKQGYQTLLCQDEENNNIVVCFSPEFMSSNQMFAPLWKTLEKKGHVNFRCKGELKGQYLKAEDIRP